MQFSATACIRFGWEVFKKRPWFLAGAFLFLTIVTSIISSVSGAVFGDSGAGAIPAFVINLCVQTLAGIGMVALSLKVHDDVADVGLKDLWRPQHFLNYLGMSILFFFAAVIGFVLFVIPGFIVILTYYFAGYFVVEHSLGPIKALKASARITKGHRLQLLGLFGLVLLVNILGVLCLLVGLLVSVPVGVIAVAHAYRTLARQAGQSPVSA